MLGQAIGQTRAMKFDTMGKSYKCIYLACELNDLFPDGRRFKLTAPLNVGKNVKRTYKCE